MIELPEAIILASQITKTLHAKTIQSALRGNSPSKFTFYSGSLEFYASTLPRLNVGNAIADGGLIVIDLLQNSACTWQLVLGGGGERILFHSTPATLPKKYQLLLQFTDSTFLSVSVQGWGFAQLFNLADSEKRWCGFDKGLMPSDPHFTLPYFHSLFAYFKPHEKRSLKEFIITKPGVRGIGNGYLQDILFHARLNPRTPAASLTPRQQSQLHKAIVKTVSTAIARHGRTEELDLFGHPGKYARILSSSSPNQPCPNCQTPIQKEAFLGGSIYYCPQCQPKPAPTPRTASSVKPRRRSSAKRAASKQ